MTNNETIKNLLDEIYSERFLFKMFLIDRGLLGEFEEWSSEMMLKYDLMKGENE